jgi:hypothetical protein
MSFKFDSRWAAGHEAEIEEILLRHVGVMISVRKASDREDCKQATDVVIEVTGGEVALRIRDTKRTFRDWTIRTRRVSGVPTEMHKLKAGFARWYLVAWCRLSDGKIGDYVLIDLDKVRSKGLLDKDRKEQSADDGETFFVYITVNELREHGCLAADACASLSPLPQANPELRKSVKESAEAEHTRSEARGDHCRRVLAMVREYPGSTAGELHQYQRDGPNALDGHEVSRCLADLKNTGQVVQGKARACWIAGTSQVTWWPAEGARHEDPV